MSTSNRSFTSHFPTVGASGLAVITLVLAACGEDGGPTGVGDSVGSIQVTTSTTGPRPDPDGYTVTVDDTVSANIDVNGAVTFTNLAPGSHAVDLSGVASNCPVTEANPSSVNVAVGDTARVTYNLECAHLVYVTNVAGFVSVIATATNTVVATINVGGNARGVAITPDGAFAYVTNRDADAVSVIDVATNTVIGTVDIGEGSLDLAVLPTGGFVYVATTGDSLTVIETPANSVLQTIDLDGPGAIDFLPNGTFAYVTSAAANAASVDDNELRVIETSGHTVVDTLDVLSATYVAVTPDGGIAYVTASSFSRPLQVIETAGNTVVDSVPGLTGRPVVISPDGGFAYVPGGGPGDGTSRIWIFETASNTVVDSVLIGAPTLQDLAFTPDGMFAYGSEPVLADVWIIETATHTVVDTLDIGGGPWAVAITPD